MRLWRALNALGCMLLRDGAYLLPDGEHHAASLAELAAQTSKEGGQAWVVTVTPRSVEDESAFVALFDRAPAYRQIVSEVRLSKKALGAMSPAEIGKTLRRLRKDLQGVQRLDFFPNDASLDAQAVWSEFNDAANAVLSPNEPHAQQRPIARLGFEDYQARTWATRRNLWVDRVASAWLIRRFIDKRATFLWLDSPVDCPANALGFDFDGAVFTHVGKQVTFEVLLASFGLDDDPGLVKLAVLVHCLDVGGPAAPEALGFEAILSGARSRLPNDDALLEEIGTVLDSLHAYYKKESMT